MWLENLIRRFRASREGTVSIEFAVWAVSLLTLSFVGLEYGLYHKANAKLTKAINAGVVTAFSDRDMIDTNRLRLIVGSTYQDRSVPSAPGAPGEPTVTTSSSGFSVDITCNGAAANCVNVNRDCVCVTGFSANQTPIFEPAICSSVCPSGGDAGFFVTIAATSSTTSIISSPVSPPASITSSTTIRLE